MFNVTTQKVFIKNKINLRKRFFKSNRRNSSQDKLDRIRALNQEVKKFFEDKKKSRVRRNIYPGNSASLWNAVKKSRDVNPDDLPNTLYVNNEKINAWELPDKIANYFNTKIGSLSSQQLIDMDVYNGTPKIVTISF